MTVRVRRAFEFDAPPERIWEFISDPRKRAEAISVVESYEVDPETNRATWQIRLPIPFLDSTAAVETEDVDFEPPRYVRFVGRSKVMRVTGEHTVEEREGGTRLLNEFVVDGRVPGVERFFERNLDRELDNLEAALRRETASSA
jgi:carbon monoxide dehydrogenase subunit G